MRNKNSASSNQKQKENILVACEESQIVCTAIRSLGYNAFSCDIIEPSGDHPEWHIQGDVIPLLNGNCSFKTMDGTTHVIQGTWDMILAFPPCTHLAVSGARHFAEKQRDGRQQAAIEFFMQIANANCPRIAIENPIGIMSTKWRKPDQIIQPWQFGHPETKATCLWLKGLPILKGTKNVKAVMESLPVKEKHRIWCLGSGHAKERSKTFPGIANAMVNQWLTNREG